MKMLMLILTFTLAGTTGASAACYADYKAKQDGPLKLHYGVIQLPDRACNNRKQARRVIARRISAGGWQLLNIVSFFGGDGLEQRKSSAADFYLRY